MEVLFWRDYRVVVQLCLEDHGDFNDDARGSLLIPSISPLDVPEMRSREQNWSP